MLRSCFSPPFWARWNVFSICKNASMTVHLFGPWSVYSVMCACYVDICFLLFVVSVCAYTVHHICFFCSACFFVCVRLYIFCTFIVCCRNMIRSKNLVDYIVPRKRTATAATAKNKDDDMINLTTENQKREKEKIKNHARIWSTYGSFGVSRYCLGAQEF